MSLDTQLPPNTHTSTDARTRIHRYTDVNHNVVPLVATRESSESVVIMEDHRSTCSVSD